MCPANGNHAGGGEEVALVDLIRIAQELLARVERNGFSTSPVESDLGERRVEWNLTNRERGVAELLVEGLSNRRIARRLEISERTVKNHLHSIFCKLEVGDRTQAVIKLMRKR